VGRVVVVGESARVDGFALAGAVTLEAGDPEAVRKAWELLPDDTAVVLLTPDAAAALGEVMLAGGDVLTVVMPR